MACLPGAPVLCTNPGQAVGNVLGSVFADQMREGAAWVIKTTIGWWIDVPAIDLTTSPADKIRSYVLWLALVVATAGVMWQALAMILSRRPEPALRIGAGLFTLAFWAAVGITGPAAALRAGDAFSSWVLNAAAHGGAADRLVHLASLDGIDSAGAVIVLGLVMMIGGLVQAILMLFREAALVILAGVVVLAAAGQFTGATRPWLGRVIGWMLALICYKPAAALVYASALTLVGDGTDARTIFVGITMILLAIIALPALMKFFTWATGTAGGGVGGLAALAGASAAAMHAKVALDSMGGASRQAEHISNDLGPPSGPGGGVPGAGPGSGSGGGPTGAGPTPPATPTAAANPYAGPQPMNAARNATQAAGPAATQSAGAGVAVTGAAAGAGPVGIGVIVAGAAARTASRAAQTTTDSMTDKPSQ